MNLLLRRVAKDLRYRTLHNLVDQKVHLAAFDKVIDSVTGWLACRVAHKVVFCEPEEKYIRFSVAKYGILDLTYFVEGVSWREVDRRGIATLSELGFARHDHSVASNETFEDDPTCLELLGEDLHNEKAFLRLFLENRPNALGSITHLVETLKKEDSLSEQMRRMLRGDESALEQVIHHRFPDDFIVADACLTNATSVWFHKHSYL